MRDSSIISLQVTVAARSSLTVNLTYEELLTRRRGQYRHAVSVDPGQVRWAAYPPGAEAGGAARRGAVQCPLQRRRTNCVVNSIQV